MGLSVIKATVSGVFGVSLNDFSIGPAGPIGRDG
jgi:hypothetical protein